MVIYFVVLILMALAGLFQFGGSLLFCVLLLGTASAGAALSLMLKGRRRAWAALLVPVCLVLCLLTGQKVEGGAREYNDRLYAAAEQIDRGDLDRGVELLDELDEEYGVTDRSLYARAEVWLSLGEYREASVILKQIQDRKARNWYVYMEKIIAVQGTEEELENLYLTAAEELPDDGRMQYMAGLTKLSEGSYESAAYYFKRAVALDEEDAISCYYLGVIYQEQGRLEEAEQCFAEALRRGVDEEKEAYIQWYLEQMRSV